MPVLYYTLQEISQGAKGELNLAICKETWLFLANHFNISTLNLTTVSVSHFSTSFSSFSASVGKELADKVKQVTAFNLVKTVLFEGFRFGVCRPGNKHTLFTHKLHTCFFLLP